MTAPLPPGRVRAAGTQAHAVVAADVRAGLYDLLADDDLIDQWMTGNIPVLGNLTYGTHSQNIRDKRAHGTDHNAAKTHCPQGHPYDEANTYHSRRVTNRKCKACTLARGRNRGAVAA